jgi:4-amino-4-deoxy-L-arabinose transferase-like glycosyltransferase
MPTRSLAALTVAAVALSFFLALGQAPLFDVDEGAFSQATLEMFQRGDYLSTFLNGVPRYDKPILVYWLQAASVLALGPTELAFRLPSALCGTLWCVLVFAFTRRNYGDNAGLVAAAITATSVGVFAIGRAATADALLNLCLVATMFAAWLHLKTGERKWLYAVFAAAGLGVMAKGPVAILIPGVVTFLFCILRKDIKVWLRAILDWKGILLFALIVVPWYAAIFHKDGWAFFEGFIMKHNVGRFGSTLQGHGGSLLYYFPVVLIATLPHTGFFARIFTRLKTLWRDDLSCYLLLWFAFVFVFFSLSGTKLPHYVLYGMTGMFILAALEAEQIGSGLWLAVPAALFFGFLLALPAMLDAFGAKTGDVYYREVSGAARGEFPAEFFAFCGAALAVSLWIAFDRRLATAFKPIVCGVLAVVTLAVFVVPAFGRLLQEPIKEAALLARSRNYSVIMWGINAPSFSVYYGRPTPARVPMPGDIVITRAKRLAEEPSIVYQSLFASRGIVLARILE